MNKWGKLIMFSNTENKPNHVLYKVSLNEGFAY